MNVELNATRRSISEQHSYNREKAQVTKILRLAAAFESSAAEDAHRRSHSRRLPFRLLRWKLKATRAAASKASRMFSSVFADVSRNTRASETREAHRFLQSSIARASVPAHPRTVASFSLYFCFLSSAGQTPSLSCSHTEVASKAVSLFA